MDTSNDPFLDATRRVLDRYDNGLDGATANELRTILRAGDLRGVKASKATMLTTIRAELAARAEADRAAQQPTEQPAAESDGCAACAAGEPATTPYAPLPDDLTLGLTVWGGYGGAQMRLETTFANPDDPTSDITGAVGALALAFRTDAPRAGQTEEGGPIYHLNRDEARALRDLLNLATARNFL